ncbi:MAG: tripartite tricarboxylate transporter substrate binding protein [Burkholderiaceae bacterium]|nr:tripartite tricarboxylate transporter substrate binding protein [Desulfobacterales bacterium]MDP3139641.1 tripartite tricarboxylate transporter substrate binding protein [Burkholderiaceae bacterium]
MKALIAAAVTAFCTCAVVAQDFPTKPVRLIVSAAPGGATDIAARVLSIELTKSLGQPVVVENRAGASGAIGANAVATATPDGYTLLVANLSNTVINKITIKNLPYDPVKSFSAIGLISQQPMLIVVQPSLPVTTLKEFIAYAKARPGQVKYSSAASSTQLTTELLASMTGVSLMQVPYNSSSDAIRSLMSGTVEFLMDPLSSTKGFVDSGQLRALAITSRERTPLAPNVPTVSEQIQADFEVSSWQGLLAPAGTPPKVVEFLNKKVADALNSVEVKAAFLKQSSETRASTPAEFTRHLERELVRWQGVATKIGLVAR